MRSEIGFRMMREPPRHQRAGFANKVRAAVSHVAPDSTLAEMHRSMAQPGGGKDEEPKSKRERTDRPRA